MSHHSEAVSDSRRFRDRSYSSPLERSNGKPRKIPMVYERGRKAGKVYPREAWLARLNREHVQAAVRNASWAAQRIARYIYLLKQRGADWPTIDKFLGSPEAVRTKLKLYAVHEPLMPGACKMARLLAEYRLKVGYARPAASK